MDSLADEAMTTGDKNDVRHVMRYGREKGEGKGEMSGEWERGEGRGEGSGFIGDIAPPSTWLWQII